MLFVKFSGADFRICCSEIRIWSHFIYLYIFDSASTFDIISYMNEMPSQFSTHLRITQFGFMISIYCIYQVSVCLPYCKKCDTSNHLNHSVMFFVVFFIIG